MPDAAFFSRTARGYWAVHQTFDAAIACHRRLAGDRRGKTELWKLVEGVWLYVGPRPRRRSSRHVAHVLTADGATLVGFTIPDPIRTVLVDRP